MRHRFWIVLVAGIGFAQASFGLGLQTTCPECADTISFVAPSAVPEVSCPDCGVDLEMVSIPSSCSDLGGTVDASQCKLADGQTCAVDNLEACLPLASEELEDWGEDANPSATSTDEAASAPEPAQ